MSVSAPPRPPSIEDPPDLDALEALIEEARLRARRRRRQRNTAVALVALLVGFAAYVGFARGGSENATSAGSAAQPAQAARNAGATSMSFRLVSTPTSVDREPKGVESKGDALYVKSVLRNWSAQFHRPANAVVGSDSWVLTAPARPGWSLVKATVKLSGGTLRLQGRVHWSANPRFVPVIGGTGRFVNARGTVRIQERASLPSLNDYRLRLP